MLMTFDKRTVMGMLKTSDNADTVYAQKELMLKGIKTMKWASILFFVVGGLLTVTVIGAIVGIPLIVFGWFVRKKATKNIETIEAAYAELSSTATSKAAPA